MTEREALKLALEALEDTCFNSAARVRTASKIIKEALKEHAMYEVQRLGQEIQPEQEPVGEVEQIDIDDDGTASAWFTIATEPLNLGDKLYTTPPQRTWVGLTDEDKKQIAKEANYNWEMTTGEYAERIGRLTEAKLKEKNA